MKKNIPDKKLKKGDVATIVEYHHLESGDDGYSLEIFNVSGETVAVVTVAESEIEPLKENEIFNVRSFEAV